MKEEKLRVIFMGTPDFAVASLKALVENDINVVAVITSVDKPTGRGQKVSKSAIKQYAESVDIPILQPKNLKNPEFVEELRSYKADLQVIVAFRMLPVVVWDMPRLGSLNLHASLLPDYRGAAPINWVIINGEQETGITTFFLKHEIDTGDLIYQEKIEIDDDMTAGELHDKLMVTGADLVLKTVRDVQAGDYPQMPQDHSKFQHKAPKIFKEDCEIKWDRPVEQVYNHVRGLSPYPAAWTVLEDKQFKIYKARKFYSAENNKPGSIKTDNKKYLHVYCEDGYLDILELQMQGKKRMDIVSFLNGFKF